MAEPAPSHSARGKLDEDDHDLLTFGEAGERLRIEIAAAERRVAELTEHGLAGDLDNARRRLDALRAAAQRNSAHPINDANFERFFGYHGKAKRNLPVSESGG
ncbi:acyl-CoA synthetase [Mycobacterium arosiense]|uniref:Acyl-CoA synthetase n=1 Tax=Mycobacterium arosiense ATCC BAA-1401 = DSM 45069 TaxID=1265311 RepID=A0A1W9ZQG2_MYCAI|nr:acyl-CoA synthetase [Mycobacterium arosiense]ORA19903.1 acyl-CoA synthetase [Mycobacterium arosiense ATCC BAA-1401 = DSM 45069]